MPQTPQTYANHRKIFPLFHYVAAPILLANVIYAIRNVYLAPSGGTVFALVVAIGLVALALSARVMALTVQDRVIRLEMWLRLQRVLPPDLQARIPEFTRQQLVSLRFAGDDELPALCRDVLAGACPGFNDIKRRVKNWQGDDLRA